LEALFPLFASISLVEKTRQDFHYTRAKRTGESIGAKSNVIKLSFVCSRKGAKSQSLDSIPLRLRVFARVIFRKN
jgi:hypothetical protein